jgi:hypothetical protein
MDELWNEVTEARSKAASAVSDAYEAKLTAEAAEAAGAHQVRGSVIGEGRFQPMDYDDTVDFRRSVAAQVLRDMDAGEFVSEQRLREIMAELATQEASERSRDISGISTRLRKAEQDLFDTNGVVPRLKEKVKFLEDKRVGQAVERGGYVFKDQHSVDALVKTQGVGKVAMYCVDAVGLIMLSEDPYETIADGMATEAAAYKAEYESLLEACNSVSYGLTYPEGVMEKCKGKKAPAMSNDGWTWTQGWSSYSAFEGTTYNGAYAHMKKSLAEVKDMIKKQSILSTALTKPGRTT